MCHQLIEHKLFVEGWTVLDIFKCPKCIKKLAVLLKGEEIIARALLYNYGILQNIKCHEIFIACYVKPEYRLCGHGRLLIKTLKPDKYVEHGDGIKGSCEFWKKVRPDYYEFKDYIIQLWTKENKKKKE